MILINRRNVKNYIDRNNLSAAEMARRIDYNPRMFAMVMSFDYGMNKELRGKLEEYFKKERARKKGVDFIESFNTINRVSASN